LRHRRRAEGHRASVLEQHRHHDAGAPETVDPTRIAAAVDRLGPWLDVAATHLATACVTIDNLLNPQAIVIGGIVPAALLDRLVERLQQRLDRTQLTGHGIRIVKPGLDLETPALGGAALPLFNGLAPSASSLEEPAAQRFRSGGAVGG
jgi:predicted NBD/HSP70 family sugar kinase